MNEAEPPRRPITKQRAAELVGIGAQIAYKLAGPPDEMTLSDILLVVSTIAGVAIASVEDPTDRIRLMAKVTKLALATAEDARRDTPVFIGQEQAQG